MINLKVSEKEKYKNDNQWFKDYMNHIAPFGSNQSPDYDKMSKCYRAVNMDLTDFKDSIKLFCNPLGDLVDTMVDDLVAYPELKNKLSTLKGELIKRNDQMRLQLLTAQAKRAKNEELIGELQATVDEKLGLELMGLQEQMAGMPQEEVQQFVAQLRSKHEPEDLLSKDWLSELEIFYNKGLKFCYQDQEVKFKQADTIEDAATADRMFVANVWKHGKPGIEVRNTLHIDFHKNPNEPMIHKGDWIAYRKAITIADAIASYNLTDTEIEDIGGAVGGGNYKKYSTIHGSAQGQAERQYDHSYDSIRESLVSNTRDDKTEGLNQADSYSMSLRHGLIYETHFEFKAFKKIIFLSYFDEEGKQIVEVLSSEFEIPKDAKKEKYDNRFDQETQRYTWFDELSNTEFQAEELWIPRAYEVIRLGGNVYPICREVPYQEVNVEDPFGSFELSTKGAIFNARNAQSVSLVEQALPSYFQYCYIKHVQNRELSKYKGFIHSLDVDQIPESLGADAEGKNVNVKDALSRYLAILRKTNIDMYSGSQGTLGGLPPSTRSPGSNGFTIGTAIELMNLENLAQIISRNISMSMGISPQREANYTQGTNVSDNQQAVINSYTITEPLFYRHSMIWKDVLSRWLRDFRKYCQVQMEVHNLKDLSFEIWLPDGTSELLKVTPKSLEHADIGLFLVSNSAADKYSDMMLQMSHAFSQNQGQGIAAVSSLIKDIVGGESPEAVHKKIMILEKQQQDSQFQLQQQQAEQQAQLQQMQAGHEKSLQEFELMMLREKAALDHETKIQVATISALGFAQNQDVDNDGTPDVIELHDMSLKKAKLDLEIKKQADTVELKKQELEIKKKVANKKPASK